MMAKSICHYAILHFTPFPEAGEFVNVGVLVVCPSTGFIGYSCDERSAERVAGLFPGLDLDVFRDARRAMCRELDRVAEATDRDTTETGVRAQFTELTRPREGLIALRQPGTIAAESAEQALANLSEHFVTRHVVTGGVPSVHAVR